MSVPRLHCEEGEEGPRPRPRQIRVVVDSASVTWMGGNLAKRSVSLRKGRALPQALDAPICGGGKGAETDIGQIGHCCRGR